MTDSRSAKWLFLASLLGCGAHQGPTQSVALTPETLYPLREGAVWTYDVDTGIDNVLAISRVVAVRGASVEVRNDGGESMTYERGAQGIYRPQSESWLLRSPIEIGATWDAGGGRTARVTSVTESFESMAGSFTSCVRVEETGGEDGRSIATTYCPEVGPARLEVSMRANLTGETARVDARLRAFVLGES